MNVETVEYWTKKKGTDAWIHIAQVVTERKSNIRIITYHDGVLQHPMRVLNKKYWPYQYRMTEKSFTDMERWCYENLKSANWRRYGMLFAFKRMQDASYFMLMWS